MYLTLKYKLFVTDMHQGCLTLERHSLEQSLQQAMEERGVINVWLLQNWGATPP